MNPVNRRPVLRRWVGAALRRVAGTMTHVSTRDAVVALTFDDGPDPASTPRLLDILEAHHARATFFMVGVRAQRHPELVARVAAGGHVIGNHSWDHPSFPLISGRERREQIRACGLALAPYGHRLFRPPFGDQDLASWLDARWMGYRVVAWNVPAWDWEDYDGPSIVNTVTTELKPGDVMLFHDGLFQAPENRFFDREPMLSAVESLLDRLAGRFRFVTVPELLRHGRAHWEHWTLESSLEFLNQLTQQQGPARRYPPAIAPAGRLGGANPREGAGG